MDDATHAPRSLREALASVDAAAAGLLALTIPGCPACELLPTSLRELQRARPALRIAVALMATPADWADREELLWPRSIHPGRASMPLLAVLDRRRTVATRAGGGPASAIDAWLTETLGPPQHPVPPGLSEAEAAHRDAVADLRVRHLTVRGRRSS